MGSKNVEDDIRRLKAMAKQAAEVGDADAVQSITEAYNNAVNWYQYEKAKGKDVPAEGVMKSYGLGAQRQMGRYWATAKEGGQLLGKAYEGSLGEQWPDQEEIWKTEREKEKELKQRTREHPIASFLGEATALLPFAAGRTPATAFGRGALGGALTYNEDPTARVTQALVGGGANILGRGILSPVYNRETQAIAGRTGMELLPEQRAPTFFQNSIEKINAFKKQAFDTSERNARKITQEALRTLGEAGDTFNYRTFENVTNRSRDLFNRAVGTTDPINFGQGFRTRLQNYAAEQDSRIVRSGKVVNVLRRLSDMLAANNHSLSPQQYQDVRSELTRAIRETSQKNRPLKRVLGKIVEMTDDEAEASLSTRNPQAVADFQEARRLWRQYNLFKTEGVINEKTGIVDPERLRRLLRREDESGFLLNRDQSNLYSMLRVDASMPGGSDAASGGIRITGNTGGGAGLVAGVKNILEKPLIGASRLPQRAVEGAPLSMSVPFIKESLPSNTTERVIDALISGDDSQLSETEKASIKAKRKMVQEALINRGIQ